MLILERGELEKVYLDVGDTRITVVLAEIRSLHKVKLGFDAPPEVRIIRAELERETP